MARPVKRILERRTKTRLIRLTDAEDRAIRRFAAAARVSASDYLRTLGLHGGGAVRREKAVPPELVFELNKVGVNLNQIAHKFNATGQHDPAELTRTLEQLNALLDKVQGHGAEPHER